MIAAIVSFSIKSLICSAVFGAYYVFALKNAPTNSFNRFYLLGAALLSLVLPLAPFELLHVSAITIPEFPLLDISGMGTTETVSIATPAQTINWSTTFSTIYFTISTLLIAHLAIQSLSLYFTKGEAQKTGGEGFVLIHTTDPRAPFSFMNRLFWPTHMRQDSPEGKSILLHELAHIRQQHTLDKIFMQLMLAICWLNPIIWLIKKELWLQHEFLADKHAIKDHDGAAFASMLLYSVSGSANRAIINPFFQSSVKRRLFMLSQPNRNAYSFMRRFLSVPVLLMAVTLLSVDSKQSGDAVRAAKKIVLVLDAAHGGNDAGGKSAYGYKEKDFTLALCRKITALSGEYNVEVVSTRTDDAAPSLQERVEKSNSSNADVFLSVHINQSSAVRDNAYQLGVSPKSPDYSKARLIASAIASKLKTQELPVEVVDYSMSYVLRENRHPALLIECGNLDDAENIALLKDEKRTEQLCRNILSGIVNYQVKLNAR